MPLKGAVWPRGATCQGQREARERGERERDNRLHSPCVLHAPIHWAELGGCDQEQGRSNRLGGGVFVPLKGAVWPRGATSQARGAPGSSAGRVPPPPGGIQAHPGGRSSARGVPRRAARSHTCLSVHCSDSTPYTLHPTPFDLKSTPCTVQPHSYTLGCRV